MTASGPTPAHNSRHPEDTGRPRRPRREDPARHGHSQAPEEAPEVDLPGGDAAHHPRDTAGHRRRQHRLRPPPRRGLEPGDARADEAPAGPTPRGQRRRPRRGEQGIAQREVNPDAVAGEPRADQKATPSRLPAPGRNTEITARRNPPDDPAPRGETPESGPAETRQTPRAPGRDTGRTRGNPPDRPAPRGAAERTTGPDHPHREQR